MTTTPPSLKTRHGLIVERIAQLRSSRDILAARLETLRADLEVLEDERNALALRIHRTFAIGDEVNVYARWSNDWYEYFPGVIAEVDDAHNLVKVDVTFPTETRQLTVTFSKLQRREDGGG